MKYILSLVLSILLTTSSWASSKKTICLLKVESGAPGEIVLDMVPSKFAGYQWDSHAETKVDGKDLVFLIGIARRKVNLKIETTIVIQLLLSEGRNITTLFTDQALPHNKSQWKTKLEFPPSKENKRIDLPEMTLSCKDLPKVKN